MKKLSIKSYIAGLLTMIFLFNSMNVFAETQQKIDAIFGRIKLVVNGQSVDKETLLYNGTTYVPLRAAAEALDKEVSYDEATQTAYINDKTIAPPPVVNEPPKPTPTPTVDAKKGMKENPYKLNETYVFQLSNGETEIKFVDFLRGDQAKQVVESSRNSTTGHLRNTELEDGFEFIAVKIKAKVLKQDSPYTKVSVNTAWLVTHDENDFRYGAQHIVYDEFSADLVVGDEVELTAIRQVKKGDKVKINYWSGWFDLN